MPFTGQRAPILRSAKPHALGLLDPPRIRGAGVLLRIVKVYVAPLLDGSWNSIAFTAEPELGYRGGTSLKSKRPSRPCPLPRSTAKSEGAEAYTGPRIGLRQNRRKRRPTQAPESGCCKLGGSRGLQAPERVAFNPGPLGPGLISPQATDLKERKALGSRTAGSLKPRQESPSVRCPCRELDPKGAQSRYGSHCTIDRFQSVWHVPGPLPPETPHPPPP